ncbi:MAG: hypothetical protein JWL76_1091 [Thermoleophilia bacterium]|nr:hypothetical protein [Thermoleophilia bacterium]
MAPSDEHRFMPPASQPRAVTGGIRLQSRRGGASWWTRRWLAALEAGAVGERYVQALEDARRGRVLELEVGLGSIRARVQGTRRAPHEVTIRLAAIDQLAWLRIAEALAARGDSRAELLARQMPESVDAVFRREGVSLFPLLDDDLDIACSCEDWSTPCRHALAASLLVGEAMDADPLLAFRARGIEPALLMAIVSGGAGVGAEPVGGIADDADAGPESDVSRLLPAERGKLDAHAAAEAESAGWVPQVVSLDAPPIDAPLVRILGAPPMWRGADSFEPAMRRLYARVASDPRTIALALGSSPLED